MIFQKKLLHLVLKPKAQKIQFKITRKLESSSNRSRQIRPPRELAVGLIPRRITMKNELSRLIRTCILFSINLKACQALKRTLKCRESMRLHPRQWKEIETLVIFQTFRGRASLPGPYLKKQIIIHFNTWLVQQKENCLLSIWKAGEWNPKKKIQDSK